LKKHEADLNAISGAIQMTQKFLAVEEQRVAEAAKTASQEED
jgi:hypothetical protein